jgi:hypothetical protein
MVASQGGEFLFDTGTISGKLRASGRSLGLSGVIHRPSGLTLTQSRLAFGLLSCYRVFTGGVRHGPAAWDWPSGAALLEDNSLETKWPEAPDRPFELSTVYRWTDAATLDFTATVHAREELPSFEVFVASYFDARLTPAVVHTQTGFRAAADGNGKWQIFPRDAAAGSLIRSGRWLIPPNPIEWTLQPRLSHALAFRRDEQSGVTAVLMSPPADCIAISAPEASDIHYSTYLSLFGRTIKTGAAVTARVRLAIRQGASEQDILNLYRAYVAAQPRAR